jgi:uncharacterized RDD family membrane protein YckC
MTDQPAPPAPPPTPESSWSAPPPAPAASSRPGPMPGWHYAGFWVRFLAFLIDAILLGIISAAFTPVWGPQVTTTGTNFEVNAQANAIGTVVGLIYFAGFWSWRGQTVGMMPFNMQVVGVADGKKIDFIRGLLRYVGFIIAAIPLLIGLIWAAFDARKQGWHAKIASTVVIRPN